MKTKLVYVLTCNPEDTYIEQALMAFFSARCWNPDAWIALLTDNKTSEIIHNGRKHRSEILQYVSEEIVSSFDDSISMMYRSRWIKTRARELVSGDFLFIDCDTICCKSLEGVDSFKCSVGAVLESHLPIRELNFQMQNEIERKAQLVGWSVKDEEYYFSSGVIYAKDIPEVYELYKCWHKTWKEGVVQGVNIDQPSLAKANIDCNHIIQRIPDSYNCILFTQPQNTRSAHILHIASFRNPSVLFEDRTLMKIRAEGLSDEKIRSLVLNPCRSFRPFDYDILHSTLFQRIKWTFDIYSLEGSLIKSMIWMIRKRFHVIRHHTKIKDNVCRKDLAYHV